LAGCWQLHWAAGCSRGCRATCGGHAHEAPGMLYRRDVPAGHVEGSAFVASLCPVAGWEGCSANTLTVSTGGWPMRLLFAFGPGAGQIAGASHKEDPPVCMLGSRGQAGLLVRVYFIYHAPGWLRGLGALRSQFVTSKMSHVLISYSPSAAIIDSMMLESSSLAMAKLFLPASFSDAPTR
jgi:hypothetical protein